MRVEITEAMSSLPRFLSLIAKGESVVFCDHDRPVAELRPISAGAREPRPIGLAKGTFTVPPEFFEPLPDELLEAFEGRN